jgi:O-antigen/teichoic acid export membrane protein
MRLRLLGLSLGASLAIQGTNVLTGILLARTLGPEGRGELTAALLWPMMLAGVGSLSLMDATTYRAAKSAPVGTLAGSALVLCAIQSIPLIAIGALVIPLALSSYDAEPRLAALLYLAYIPLNLVTLAFLGVLNGLHRFRRFHLLRLLVIVSTACGLVALWAADELTVLTAVLVYIAAETTTATAVVVSVLRAKEEPLAFSRPLASELVRFGLRSHLGNMSSFLSERVDQLFVSVVLGPAKLGLYVIAVTLTSLSSFIGSSVALVALPTLAGYPEAARRAAARAYVAVTVILSALLTIPLLLFTPQVIELAFGEEFLGATDAARVLLVAAVVLATNRVFGAILRAVNRPLAAGGGDVLALIVTAAGLAILLPAFGILGAAIASLLAYATGTVWSARRVAQALSS